MGDRACPACPRQRCRSPGSSPPAGRSGPAVRPMPPRRPFTRWVRNSGTTTIACGRTSRMLSAQRSIRDSAKASVAPLPSTSSVPTRSSMWLSGRIESTTSPGRSGIRSRAASRLCSTLPWVRTAPAGDALLVNASARWSPPGPIQPIHARLPGLCLGVTARAPARWTSARVTTPRSVSAAVPSTMVGAMSPKRDSCRSSSTNSSRGRRPRAICSIRASDSPG